MRTTSMLWAVAPIALSAIGLSSACGGGGESSSGTSNTTTSGEGAGGAGGKGTGGSAGSGGTGTSSTGTGGAASCTPGAEEACYTGPFGTEGVGICKGGKRTCDADGKGFGPCEGEVLPADETCMSIEDEDCDGKVNEEGEGCVCIPGSVTTCYSGPPLTEGVGVCIAGILTCLPDGTGYGPCQGEVVPTTENCATPEDEDCDGQTPLCPALWDKRFGDVASQFAWGLALDSMDASVIIGDLTGAADFGGGTLTSAGISDVFLTKLDASGAHVWSKIFGNTSLQSGQSVAVDANGNIIVVGYFQGSINLGGTNLTTGGGADMFVAKLDPTGAHLWSKKFGSATDDQLALAVAVDPTGNVLLTGALVGAIGFGGTTLTSAGGSDVFVVKLDGANGNHLWSKKFGDAGVAQTGRAIASDAMGNVFVTGDFNGTLNFGGAALTSAGGADVFVAKLDPTGAHVWSARFGDGGFQIGRGITTDANGNAILVGEMDGSVDFGGGALGSKGSTDAFVAMFDPTGLHLASVVMGGSDYDSANAVSARGGNIAVTGYFAGNADFGGKPLVSAGGRDAFLLKLSGADLKTLSARAFGDAAFYQSGQAVALDSMGNSVMAGFFFGTLDFGNGALTSVGDADVFVAKLPP